jgi:hypothetical protein
LLLLLLLLLKLGMAYRVCPWQPLGRLLLLLAL